MRENHGEKIMSFVISAIQSYSNTIQQYDAVSSTQNNNQERVNAINNLDMNVIQNAGPSDPTVAALCTSDKKKVLENANNGMKYTFLQAWQDSLDKQTKKQIAEDFKFGLD